MAAEVCTLDPERTHGPHDLHGEPLDRKRPGQGGPPRAREVRTDHAEPAGEEAHLGEEGVRGSPEPVEQYEGVSLAVDLEHHAPDGLRAHAVLRGLALG